MSIVDKNTNNPTSSIQQETTMEPEIYELFTSLPRWHMQAISLLPEPKRTEEIEKKVRKMIGYCNFHEAKRMATLVGRSLKPAELEELLALSIQKATGFASSLEIAQEIGRDLTREELFSILELSLEKFPGLFSIEKALLFFQAKDRPLVLEKIIGGMVRSGRAEEAVSAAILAQRALTRQEVETIVSVLIEEGSNPASIDSRCRRSLNRPLTFDEKLRAAYCGLKNRSIKTTVDFAVQLPEPHKTELLLAVISEMLRKAVEENKGFTVDPAEICHHLPEPLRTKTIKQLFKTVVENNWQERWVNSLATLLLESYKSR